MCRPAPGIVRSHHLAKLEVTIWTVAIQPRLVMSAAAGGGHSCRICAWPPNPSTESGAALQSASDLTPTDEFAGHCSGWNSVFVDDLAADHRVLVTVHLLDQPSRTSREIMDDLGRVQM